MIFTNIIYPKYYRFQEEMIQVKRSGALSTELIQIYPKRLQQIFLFIFYIHIKLYY